jgi:hypothetical protein
MVVGNRHLMSQQPRNFESFRTAANPVLIAPSQLRDYWLVLAKKSCTFHGRGLFILFLFLLFIYFYTQMTWRVL